MSPIEFADRQSIPVLNPGLNGRLQVTNTIRCAISIYNPGDVAPVHLHSPNASRTILSKKGGYTVVEGERVTANRGDLILTPNGTWHDHGNDSDEPVVWIDTLDWPLMEFLDAAWVDHNMPGAQGNTNVQASRSSEGYSQPPLRPRRHQADLRHASARRRPRAAPLFHYRGEDVLRDAAQPAQGKGRPVRGHQGRLRQSGDRRAGLQDARTIRRSCCGPAKRPSSSARPPAPTTSRSKARGVTEVGGKRFEWGHNDLFVVPNFLWRRHINTGKTDAVIYSVSDCRADAATSASTTRKAATSTARSPSWCCSKQPSSAKMRSERGPRAPIF